MKSWLFVFLFSPIQLWAQTTFREPVSTDSLERIDSEILRRYYNKFSLRKRVRYTQNGKLMRIRDVTKCIRASGVEMANDELDDYLAERRVSLPICITGTVLFVGSIVGQVVGAFTDPAARLMTVSTGTSRQVRYGWSKGVGFAPVTVVGVFVIGGGLLLWPGDHLRQAVYYYNRSPMQRRTVWRVDLYGSIDHSGVRFVGRF